jgi:FkbM family methyltransferase
MGSLSATPDRQLPPIAHSESLSRFLVAAHRSHDFPARLRIVGWIERVVGNRRIIVSGRFGEKYAVDHRDLIQRKLLLEGTFEPEVQNIIASCVGPDFLVFDIGANVGVMSLALPSTRGAEVIAFEADPLCASILELNRQLSGINERAYQIERRAVAEESGSARFKRASVSNTGRSGLFLQNGVDEFDVEVTTLDDYWGRRRIDRNMFWKLDVEGSEIMVLRGAVNLLRSKMVRAIVFEDDAYLPNESPVAEFLRQFGFSTRHIRRYLSEEDRLQNFIATLDE